MHLYQISCFFLTITSILSAVGLVANVYKDNIFQCIGMFLLMVGCASRVSQIWELEQVPIDWFFVHAGIGMFAIGVFIKVVVKAHSEKLTQVFYHRLRTRFVGSFADTDNEWQRWQDGAIASMPKDRRHPPPQVMNELQRD